MYKLNPLTGKFDLINENTQDGNYTIPAGQITGVLNDDGEVISGQTVFNMDSAVNTSVSIMVFRNGSYLPGGYTITNFGGVGRITFLTAPVVGDVITILYSKY